MTNFNPLDDKNIQKVFLLELDNRDFKTFDKLPEVNGQGVYFIWADVLPYEFDSSKPIYIGKAVSSGGRKGEVAGSSCSALKKRLSEHMKSIDKAKNLDINSFKFKTIQMDEHWTVYAEQLFIKSLSPLWNREYDGFGNHSVGKTRAEQKKSKWDVTHPGRLTLQCQRATVTTTVGADMVTEAEERDNEAQ